MSLQIGQREKDGVIVLDLSGSLVLGAEDSLLRDHFRLLIAAGRTTITLNLQQVSMIDSTGLGTLVYAHLTLRKAGGRLTLFHLNPSHLKLFLLTKLATVFELFATEDDAVNSCFPDRKTEHYDILQFVESSNRPLTVK